MSSESRWNLTNRVLFASSSFVNRQLVSALRYRPIFGQAEEVCGAGKWARQDSNLGPRYYESPALTAELQAHLPMKTADSRRISKFSIDGMLTLWRASATICDMKRPTLTVRQYRHSSTHPYYLDLRAFNQGRKFFKTKAEAEAERLRQITLRERGGREAVGLPLNELSAIVEARRKLAKHGKSIDEAATFYLDHLERIRRCDVTV